MGTTAALRIHPPHRGFELLRDLVHEHTGLYFDDTKIDAFVSKISPLIEAQASDSLLDYYDLLKRDSGSGKEWPRVFDALTVQESFLWREMDQIRALVDEVVPGYFRAHPNHALNIWSAACAAGCEPLTIAMALNEAGWFDRAKINIHASDASPRAIEAARKGMYLEPAFRRLPPEMREKYFVCAGGNEGLLKVSEELHSRIRWKTANLMSEADLEPAAMTSSVIFCRNVFIYFSEYSIRKTVRGFAEAMPRPGYLFVGMAESLLRVTSDFEHCEMGDAFVHLLR